MRKTKGTTGLLMIAASGLLTAAVALVWAQGYVLGAIKYQYYCDTSQTVTCPPNSICHPAGHCGIPYSTVRCTFRRLSTELGWRSNGMLPRPRIHDLRHNADSRIMSL